MRSFVIGLGAGGHCATIIEILHALGSHELCGLLDCDPNRKGRNVLGVPVLGDDSLLGELAEHGVTHYFVGLGGTRETDARRRLFQHGRSYGLSPIEVVHARAILSPSARRGAGLIALAGAILGTNAEVGENVLLNSGAIVEHDCIVASHVHVATGARLCGGVRVGERAHIGAGAVVREGISIGEGAIVGAGAVVIRPVEFQSTVIGVPAVPMGFGERRP